MMNAYQLRDELLLHLGDREWRMDNLYQIEDKKGNVVPFVRNESQLEFWSNMWWLNVILKDRQRGFSTLIAMFILDSCLFAPHTTAGIIDITLPDAKKKLGKMVFAYHRLPESVKKQIPLVTEAKESLEWANGSRVDVSTSHRGGTLQILHVCLDASTEIVCKDGQIKKITDLEPGDKVLTSAGSYRPVERVSSISLKDSGQSMLEVGIFGYYSPLKITNKHEVLTREHATGAKVWKEAGKLERGDYLSIPIREVTNKSRDKKLLFGNTRVVPTFNLGWLCGLYLAEGSLRRRVIKEKDYLSSVQFAIHRKEIEGVVRELENLASSVDVGVPRRNASLVKVYDHNDSLTSVVTFNSRNFASFIEQNFGLSQDKMIPDKVWGFGNVFVHGLIKGYFDGDGCYANLSMVTATSTRRQFVDQLRRLLVSMRYGVPSIYFSPGRDRYGRDCQDAWTIKLYGAANWKFRTKFGLDLPEPKTKAAKWRIDNGRNPEGRKLWRRGKDCYWMRVTSIKELPASEDTLVYDVVLDQDPHDYMTVNGIVHNSEYGKIAARKPDVAKEIKTGAMNTVAPECFIMVESTAEGQEGEFFEMCQEGQRQRDQKTTLTPLDFKFHFFGWWMGSENELPEGTVAITSETHAYCDQIEGELGIKINARKRGWYQKKWQQQGDEMRREFPSTPKEAFSASIDGSYYSKAMAKVRQEGRICHVPYDQGFPVDTFWDLGMDDSMTIFFRQRIGASNRIINYYEASGEGLAHYAKVLNDLGYLYGRHYMPHDAAVRELGTGIKRSEKAEELGIKPVETVTRPRDTEAVLEGIEAVRTFLSTCWFDEQKCAAGIKCLDNYRKEWDERLGTFRRSPLHNWASHGADSFRTGAVALKGETGLMTTAEQTKSWRDRIMGKGGINGGMRPRGAGVA